MAEEKWLEVKQDRQLHKGDIVKLDFLLLSLFDWDVWYGVQLAAIEKRLNEDPRVTLLSTTHPENGQVTFKLRVDQNPITIAMIVVLITIGITIFVTFLGSWLLVKAVGGSAAGLADLSKETGWTALKIGGAVLIGVIAFKWLKTT